MMDYASYISGISFRFLKPDATPGKDGWYTIPKEDGACARLLEIPGIPIDISNTSLPCDEGTMKHRLGKICQLPRMSTFAIGAMLNYGVAEMPEGQAFVNVGVWHGYTLMCGMVGNPAKICIGVDNFSQFGGPREAFMERFRKYRSDSHRFYDMDCREYFSKVHRDPIGFYVYDGDHTYDNQLMGLQAAEPFFAKGCIILVDDTNWSEPRYATLDFISKSSHEYRTLLDTTTCCNGHPTLWNGIMILQRTNNRPKHRSRNASTREPRGPVGPPASNKQSGREAGGSQKKGGLSVPSEPKGDTMQVPLVSVIVNNYGNRCSLREAIDGALNQTYPNIEVIVVDDGSTNSSQDIIADYANRVVPVLIGNGRQPSAFEAGLAVSRGDLVSFVESDEPLPPTAVAMGIHEACSTREYRIHLANQEIAALIPLGDAFILVDHEVFRAEVAPGRRALPFLERDGRYWGLPSDDMTAIRELERLRKSGANFMVFGWPAFWWLDYYSELHKHLRSQSRCMLENDRIIVFDLRP